MKTAFYHLRSLCFPIKMLHFCPFFYVLHFWVEVLQPPAEPKQSGRKPERTSGGCGGEKKPKTKTKTESKTHQ